MQPDGKVIGVGSANFGEVGNHFSGTRFDTEGALDRSFGSDGTFVTPLQCGRSEAKFAVLQPDGKILAVGTSFSATERVQGVGLARYLANGVLDDGGVPTSPRCPQLSIRGLTPRCSSSGEPAIVTIEGSGFSSNPWTQVWFDDHYPCQPVEQGSSTRIRCQAPAHEPGRVSVTVTSPDSQKQFLERGFTYLGWGGVRITPAEGPADGGPILVTLKIGRAHV